MPPSAAVIELVPSPTSIALRLGVCVLLPAIAALGCSSGNRSTGGSPSSAAEVILPLDGEPRVDLPARVSFFFQVTSESGEPVAGLTGADFRLFENDVPVSTFESQQRLLPKPQDFRSFSLLLLDRSQSVSQSADGTQRQIEAASAYVDQVAIDASSFVGIYLFAGDPELIELSGFESDPNLLKSRLAGLEDFSLPNLSTDLYGAVIRGTQILEAESAASIEEIPNQTLSLVTFTDGRQTITSDAATLENAVAALAKSGFNAFSIGLGDEVDQDALRALGTQGSAFAQDFDDLVGTFGVVARKVRDFSNSFYFLSYCSAQRDGSQPSTHQLRVEVGSGDPPARADYLFDSTGFGGGCGFLDVAWASDLGPSIRNVRVTGLAAISEDQLYLVGNALVENADAGIHWQVFVQRLDSAGALDRDFNGGAPFWIEGADEAPHAQSEALVLDERGNLILVGSLAETATLENSRRAIWSVRVGEDTPSSRLEPNCVAAVDDNEQLLDVAIDREGRVVTAGRVGDPQGATGSRGWIARYRVADEKQDALLFPDLEFGDAGAVQLNSEGEPTRDVIRAIAIDSDGGVVAAGLAGLPAVEDLRLFRLDAGGAIDRTFGISGVSRNLGLFQEQQRGVAVDVAIDSEGRIVVAGNAAPPLGSSELVPAEQPAFWRFSPDGRPDTDFVGSLNAPYPGTGMVLLPLNFFIQGSQPSADFGAGAALSALVLDRADGLLAIGRRRNAQNHDDLALFRLTNRGTMEASYNGGGYLIEDGAVGDDGFEIGNAIVSSSDGRQYLAGSGRTPVGFSRAVLWIDNTPDDAFATPPER